MIVAQRLAASALLGVLSGRSLTPILTRLWADHPALTPGQRGAIQDFAFGACRWLGTLRAVLAQLLHAPIPDPQVEALLLVALHQLLSARTGAHAVVDNAVRNSGSLGFPAAKGLVNAVLRNYLRRQETLLDRARSEDVGRFSYPQWWIDKVRAGWPDRFADVLDAGNLHPPMTLRVNLRRGSVEAYGERLQRAGIRWRRAGSAGLRLERPLPVRDLPGFEQGLVSVQDAGAQLAAPLLDVSDGQRVLDACSAPGGKTAHLLETADIDLLALDKDAERLRRVEENLRRLRLHATLRCADAGVLDQWWDGRPFDRVLLDAPCTGSGVVRRHPDIKWLRRPEDVQQLATEQARLLDASWQTLVAGGKLLYVTCSFFPEETGARIEAFLRDHADARLMQLDHFPGHDGVLLPDTEHDGFFYALLGKQPSGRTQLDA